MKFLFELNHPKHYHQFRYLISDLKSRGHAVIVLARDKDLLLKLLREENVDFVLFGKYKTNIISKITNVFSLFLEYFKIVKKYKVDVLISKASPYGAVIARMTGNKSIIFPDSEVVWLTKRFVAPLSDVIITSNNFGLDFGKKHHRVNGLFEECYLSPAIFKPDKSILIPFGLTPDRPYFILRFISWNANHDLGEHGFSDSEKTELVKTLEEYGKVYISAEQNSMPEILNKYKLILPANLIHHALHYAKMYVGDSQSMATEAALLGTPAIRFNSFVGSNDMSNFIMLQNKYHLLLNLNSFDQVKAETHKILRTPESKNEWLKKKEEYFANKPDLNQQIVNLVLSQC